MAEYIKFIVPSKNGDYERVIPDFTTGKFTRIDRFIAGNLLIPFAFSKKIEIESEKSYQDSLSQNNKKKEEVYAETFKKLIDKLKTEVTAEFPTYTSPIHVLVELKEGSCKTAAYFKIRYQILLEIER